MLLVRCLPHAKKCEIIMHTSVLSGTHCGSPVEHSLGVLYLMLYVLFVCIVPILVMAGSLIWLGHRWMGGKRSGGDARDASAHPLRLANHSDRPGRP